MHTPGTKLLALIGPMVGFGGYASPSGFPAPSTGTVDKPHTIDTPLEVMLQATEANNT